MLGRIVGVACLLLLGVQYSIAQTTTPYVLKPQSVKANQPFDLALKNSKFSCATQFSSQSIRSVGSTYYLTFKAADQLGIPCPISDTLYGPVFQMPALTAGRDSIYAVQQQLCAPLCANPLPDLVQFAGVLTVTPADIDSNWFIQPKIATANNSFTLQLLNAAYGSCQTSFTHTSLMAYGDSLNANFVVVGDTTRVCASETRPFGPSYNVPALSPGKYPVYAAHHFACEYSTPPCLIPVVPPILVDTLIVTAASSLSPELLPPFAPINHFGVIQGYWVDGRKIIPIR